MLPSAGHSHLDTFHEDQKCLSADHPLIFPSTGQWHPTHTQPVPTTPPPRPPAPSTPPTTTPGNISVLQPRLSHWTVVSGQPTNPRVGQHHQADMWPLWAGLHQDTGSRVEETQQWMGPDSSQLRSTELGTGRFFFCSQCFLKCDFKSY